MDQRKEFVLRAIKTENFRSLCREFGISAKTGYKWVERFKANGLEGLAEESRRPRGHAREVGEKTVCEIVRLKTAHPRWGPRKIRTLHEKLHGPPTPSESSFKRILERAGLTEKRRKRRRSTNGEGRIYSGIKAESCNDIWSVDFKGWWRDADGLKVEPLTVRDEHSRMLLELRRLGSTRTETVRACFERLFEQFGLPRAIRSDNGPPFASSQGLLGLSRLSAWWLALGIDLERGRPGCPQDNGAHERMHKDVRDEFEADRLRESSQEAFDIWREEFNSERPHESLGMATPAEVYEPSRRLYEGTPSQLDYGQVQTRKVTINGTIRFQCHFIQLSKALCGWNVALIPERDGGRLEVHFSNLLLGHIDPTTASFKAASAQS